MTPKPRGIVAHTANLVAVKNAKDLLVMVSTLYRKDVPKEVLDYVKNLHHEISEIRRREGNNA